MNFNSLVADVISRLNGGNRHRVRIVILCNNRITLDVINVLLEIGLISGFKIQVNNKIWVYMRFRGGFHIFF